MQLRFQRDVFLKPLQQVVGFVEKKQTMPILSNVYLKKEGDIVLMVANDLEIQASVVVSEGIFGDDGVITLPAHKLLSILKALPDSEEEVVLSCSENARVSVSLGRSKFALQSLPADNYPLLRISELLVTRFNISQKQLSLMLNKTQYAMASNDSRVFLNGMLLETVGSEIRFVATDAHRLSYTSYEQSMVLANVKCILPRKTILELNRLLDNEELNVEVNIYHAQVELNLGNVKLITKLIDGRYPDYHKVIPLTNDKLCLVNRTDLLDAVRRVSVIGVDKLKVISLVVKQNQLEVSCRNEDGEESSDVIVVNYPSEAELNLNFNITYLLDVLNYTSEDVLQFAFFDNLRSVLITTPADNGFKHVLMPLRV